jgi:transcriptional regulator with XRE-family HTH domain
MTKKDLRHFMGNRIRALRLKQKLTQEAMAQQLGMSRAGYANIELGRSDLPASRIMAILTIFNAPPGAIFPPRTNRLAVNGAPPEKARTGTRLLTQLTPPSPQGGTHAAPAAH